MVCKVMILNCKISYYDSGQILSTNVCPYIAHKQNPIGINTDKCKKCKWYGFKIPIFNYIICKRN